MDQFLSPPLNCNRLNHNGELIESICIRENCNQHTTLCSLCKLEFHKDCVYAIKSLKDLPKLLEPRQQIQKILIKLQQRVDVFMKQLFHLIEQKLQPMNEYLSSPNLTNLNKLGLTLKETTELNILNKVVRIQQWIEVIFEEVKTNIKININNKQLQEYKNRGNLLSSQKRFKEAIEFYDQAIKLDPKFKDPWFNKGNALSNLKLFQEAIECFDQTIRLDPLCKAALNNKGNALRKQNKFSEAFDCYNKAIELDPNFTLAIKNLNFAQMRLNISI